MLLIIGGCLIGGGLKGAITKYNVSELLGAAVSVARIVLNK